MTPTSKQHRRERQRTDVGADIAKSCRVARGEALSKLVRDTDGLKWTKRLFLALLEELYISDEFDQIIGPAESLPAGRWPQAVALGIALRHSWLPNDLIDMASRLGLGHRSRTSAR